MNTIELIQNEIKTLPAFKAQEVLDFIIFLRTRNNSDDLKKSNMKQEQPLTNQRIIVKKNSTSIKSKILKIGINCAGLPLIDDRTVDEILNYDSNGIPE